MLKPNYVRCLSISPGLDSNATAYYRSISNSRDDSKTTTDYQEQWNDFVESRGYRWISYGATNTNNAGNMPGMAGMEEPGQVRSKSSRSPHMYDILSVNRPKPHRIFQTG